MIEGKLYSIPDLVTRDAIEDGSYSSDIIELLDEAKREFPKIKQEGEFDYYDDDEIDEWFKKWFVGDEG